MTQAIVADTPEKIDRFRAVTIRSAIKLYSKTGIKPNRAYTPTNMKNAAEQITGKKFKRGDWPAMIEALSDYLGDPANDA